MYSIQLKCLFYLVVASVVAAVTTASDPLAVLSQVPPCPMSCLVESISLTPCDLLDFQCQCNDDQYTRAVSDCLVAKCPVDEALSLAKIQADICNLPRGSISQIVLNCSIAVGVLAIVLAFLRILSRLIPGNKLWYDDACQAISGLIGIPYLVIAMFVTRYGLGKHIYELDSSISHMTMGKYYYAIEVMYHVHSTLFKLCMLFFYLRVFLTRFVRRTVYPTIAFIIITQTIVTLLTAFQCRPVNAVWDLDIKDRRCLSLPQIAYAGAAVNIASEVPILLIPIWPIKSLQMTLSKKLRLVVLFGMGLIVIVIACYRLTTISTLDDYRDISYHYAKPYIWTCAEVIASNVVISIPVVNILFQMTIERLIACAIKIRRLISRHSMASTKSRLTETIYRHPHHAPLESRSSIAPQGSPKNLTYSASVSSETRIYDAPSSIEMYAKEQTTSFDTKVRTAEVWSP